MSHLQMVFSSTDSEYNTEVQMLKKQVATINAQLGSMTAEGQRHKLPKQKPKPSSSSGKSKMHTGGKRRVQVSRVPLSRQAPNHALGTVFSVGKMVMSLQFVKMSQTLPS